MDTCPNCASPDCPTVNTLNPTLAKCPHFEVINHLRAARSILAWSSGANASRFKASIDKLLAAIEMDSE